MGSVVISIDAELGWGFHDLDEPTVRLVEASREGWKTLLDLLSEYQIPATWAVVGHLFLEECDGRHADHPTPPGWFDREQGEWKDRPDLRFGGSLITKLLNADVGHDVGSHSFSHVVFDDPRITREIVAAELAAAADAADRYGVEFESFVFPRNAVGYRDVLADAGYTVYRGERIQPSAGVARSVDKLARAIDPDRVRLVEPYVDEYGLVDVPPSLFLFGFEGVPRTVVESVWADPMVRQAKHGIDRASRDDGVFHIWLHPSQLVSERDVRRVRAVLEHVDRRRRDSGLAVETMADVAKRLSVSTATHS
ncbi:MAG: polysaccharide deacetylase family protein [Halodesulfurarchaeum sp.]